MEGLAPRAVEALSHGQRRRVELARASPAYLVLDEPGAGVDPEHLHSVAELGDLFGVTRSTVYRAIQRDAARQRAAAPEPQGPGTRAS